MADAARDGMVSVVVPVYNEEDNVGPLLQSLREALDRLGRPYEVILVDDGSTDRTAERLAEAVGWMRVLRVVRLRGNFGQSAALAAGFDLARGELVVTMDGDRQNDPADIPRLLDKLEEGYDVVSGWRHSRQDPLWSRRLPSRAANALISWITGVRLHDYGCALKAYRREILRDIQLYGEMHRFLPALARWVGASIGELPVAHWPRRSGVSKYGLGRTIRVLLDLMTVKFLMSYWTRPIQIFGLLGFGVGGAGALLAAVLSYQRIAHGVPLANRPILLLAILLVLVGFQFVSIGLLGEMMVRTYHESQRKPVYIVREILSGGPDS
jgi:glycosyltransferase involved in cell wall biosynthesis